MDGSAARKHLEPDYVAPALQKIFSFHSVHQLLQLGNKRLPPERSAHWGRKLKEGEEEPEQHRHWRDRGLTDFSGQEKQADAVLSNPSEHAFVLVAWSSMISPSLVAHLQALDIRSTEEGAMHFTLVMIPAAPTVVPGVCDVNALVLHREEAW